MPQHKPFILYKFTSQNLEDSDYLTYVPGFQTRGDAKRTSHPGKMRAYADPCLGAFIAPLYGFADRLFECFCDDEEMPETDGIERWLHALTPLQEIPVPAVTLKQRIIFGILTAFRWDLPSSWITWACGVLSGRIGYDRFSWLARAATYQESGNENNLKTYYAANAAISLAEIPDYECKNEMLRTVHWAAGAMLGTGSKEDCEAYLIACAQIAIEWDKPQVEEDSYAVHC